MIKLAAQSVLHTVTGDWEIRVYCEDGKLEHVALIKGKMDSETIPLVRLHSECLTGDVMGSKHCDCGEQKNAALEKIAANGAGIFLYMRQEGRGIGLANKIKAYELQRVEGLDTLEANLRLGRRGDERSYEPAANILKDIGISSIRLLSNNPEKVKGLEEFGIHVEELVPLEITPNAVNKKYLQTKKEKMGHILKNV